MKATAVALGVVVGLASAAEARAQVDWKLQGDLRVRLRAAPPRERLPVYLVLRDRLGYSAFLPHVRRLPLAERRTQVVERLRAHAARTQAPLLRDLAVAADAGRCGRVRSNWLGNFVCFEGEPQLILELAARDDVWEAWSDVAPPADACEDAAPGCGPPGNGPRDVGADRVWALGFTGQNVLVMNADSGINVRHRALRGGLWSNPGEVPGNGIDDDRNGFVDDVHGWNFAGGNNALEDGGGHGSQTAGVVIADCACDGIARGIAPGATLMTGKIASEVDQWFAIQYAVQMGADVQTSQWSFKNTPLGSPNYKMHRDIADATLALGLIRTNSTSNDGAFCSNPGSLRRRPFNVAAPGNVPAPYRDANQTLMGRDSGVLGVGATIVGTTMLEPATPCGPVAWDLQDLLAVVPGYPLANWSPLHDDYPWRGGAQMGLLKPDVVAPARTETVIGSGLTCQFRPFGGTSNATPIVAGVAALWKSANPSLTPEDVAMLVHQTAQDLGSVPGKENTYGAGKVDAYQGLLGALAVHRVDGEPAWQVRHRAGTPVRLEVDGSPGRPVFVAVGLTRQSVQLGPLASRIGAQLFEVHCGVLDAQGHLVLSVPTAPVASPVTVFTQAFVDDRAGPTGQILASNAVGVTLL